ncbi:hypothetical protein ACO2Q3_04335 [Caulobacter sp. KR2-114]|uniref:hypothetical protein n=1 Tax=Caulobacter sp. KR2-114 TaxID=3400912 RepID=UPI003C0872AC
MTAPALSAQVQRLTAAGTITPADVVGLRQAIYPDMTVGPDEAEALVDLDRALATRCREWNDLFIEALTDFVVRQQAPVDYIDEAKADWLMSRLAGNGRLNSDSALEAVVHILEAATSAPPRLAQFAMAQVKAAVLDGDGPLLQGKLEKGRVCAAEAALLQRLLYAAGGDGNVAITRAEAELLFDINDACRGADNDAAWTGLFAKALAASVMTVSGFTPVARDDEARREAWLAHTDPYGYCGIGGFFNRMFVPRPADAGSLWGDGLDSWRAHNAEVERAQSAAESVTDEEANWLMYRIGRDGVLDEAERALVAFLKAESPDIHPVLRPLLDQV